MEYNENKKHISNFYKKYTNEKVRESNFSGLRQDMIYSLGSKKKTLWASPFIKVKSLAESR